eukprot:COSAG02_NODE_2565_length_8514_cov_174.016502_7_plen_62_part_00
MPRAEPELNVGLLEAGAGIGVTRPASPERSLLHITVQDLTGREIALELHSRDTVGVAKAKL